MIQRDLTAKGYLSKIVGVHGDDTGSGGAMETRQMNSGLSVGRDSFVKFTMHVNEQLFTNFEQALFKEPGQEGRFSYRAIIPLRQNSRNRGTVLIHAYIGADEYLSASAPEVPARMTTRVIQRPWLYLPPPVAVEWEVVCHYGRAPPLEKTEGDCRIGAS